MDCTWIILLICFMTVLCEKRQIGMKLKFVMSLGATNLTKYSWLLLLSLFRHPNVSLDFYLWKVGQGAPMMALILARNCSKIKLSKNLKKNNVWQKWICWNSVCCVFRMCLDDCLHWLASQLVKLALASVKSKVGKAIFSFVACFLGQYAVIGWFRMRKSENLGFWRSKCVCIVKN